MPRPRTRSTTHGSRVGRRSQDEHPQALGSLLRRSPLMRRTGQVRGGRCIKDAQLPLGPRYLHPNLPPVLKHGSGW